MSFLLWLILTIIFLIIELITPNFVFASLTISALITSIIAYFTQLPFVQLPAFIIMLLLFIFVIKPVFKKKPKKNSDEINPEL